MSYKIVVRYSNGDSETFTVCTNVVEGDDKWTFTGVGPDDVATGEHTVHTEPGMRISKYIEA